MKVLQVPIVVVISIAGIHNSVILSIQSHNIIVITKNQYFNSQFPLLLF